MENKIFNLNGNVYIFSNETQATRNGFRHVSYLSLNDFPVSSAKCDYLNRTWETYRYQTSMLKAVRELIYERRMTIKNDFMELTGYKKMTAKRNDTPKPRVSLMGVLRAQARRETITGTARAKERIIYSITDMIVK